LDGEAQAHPAADAGGQAGGREGATPVGGHQPDGDGSTGRALHRPTHFSTFSGVGGLDLGLERAGFRTLAFSEIEAYPSAVLATHWPDTPNLGDITKIDLDDVPTADLWTGGFPCQDLSIAGRRKGMGLDHSQGDPRDRGLRGSDGEGGRSADAGGEPDERQTDDGGDGVAYGTRSGLAFAFLDLLESALLDGRGPTYVLLENVPGLFSSHAGQDMAALLAALVDLGYGVCWRTLDARYSGVPQRRRRVFILGVRVQDDDPDGHLAAERAAEILALTASRCGHSAKSRPEGEGTAAAPRTGIEIAGSLTKRYGKGVNTTLDDGALVLGEEAESGGDGEADGAAGWLDDREGLARTFSIVPEDGLNYTDDEAQPLTAANPGIDAVYVKGKRAQSDQDDESWREDAVAPTVNQFDVGDTRATALVAATVDVTQSLATERVGTDDNDAQGGFMAIGGGVSEEDPLLPPNLDSHRYRACGNAVVVNVAEWIGRRLMLAVEGKI